MKKLLYICLMILLCLSGCGIKNNNVNNNNNNNININNSVSQNNTKQEIQFVVNYLEVGFNDYQDENADKEYALEFNGEIHHLQYENTRELLARRGILHQYRNDKISLNVNAQTGEISEVICGSKLEDGEKKLTEEEIKEQADKIASRYINIDEFLCESDVDEYDNEKNPYSYRYVYKRYHENLILTGWIEIEVDVYGREKVIALATVQNNETNKGLEMIDKETIAKMDASVIEKSTEKTNGSIKDFRINQREAVEVDGKTRLLYYVDAYNKDGEYAGFSWFFEVIW